MGPSICPVDVIAVCSAEGELRPLRLRIPEEDQSLLRVDIDEIVSIDEVAYVGREATIFLCRATIGQQRRFFELKYVLRSHIWYLVRTIC